MKIHITTSVFLIFFLVCFSGNNAFDVSRAESITTLTNEHWPLHRITADQMQHGRSFAKQYRLMGLQPFVDYRPYDSAAHYMGFGQVGYNRDNPRVKMDLRGVPMVKYGQKFEYNPVSISQFILVEYGQYLKNKDSAHVLNLINAADKLIEMQRIDGSFPYLFKFRHYTSDQPYSEGWFSGMAQGQALSALARAFLLSGDEKYISCGDKALDFLQIKSPHGPMTDLTDLDPSLESYIFFQEYPTVPNVYTLNGFMFTMLGLYDWSTIIGSNQSKILFDRSVRTLVRIIPFYDMGTFSAYDLSYLTHSQQPDKEQRLPHFSAKYHKVHLELLQALNSITQKKQLGVILRGWQYMVDDTKRHELKTVVE